MHAPAAAVMTTGGTAAAAEPGAGFLRAHALRAWQHLERGFDGVFGAASNPLRHLGALGFLFFWWLAASGIYLFAMLDTSATAAYDSIARLAHLPWYLGGWLRGVHRYAADAFVVVMLAHLLREWLLGRYQGFRRFSWLTGVPLLLFAFGTGIVGFWLNWDRLGQYSAVASAEWLDALPVFGTPLARNFLGTAAVSDRLFSLFIFIHVGVPLLLLFGLWFHIQRLTQAAIFAPRALTLASTLGLLALAALAPVTSQAPADLSRVPGPLAFDWFVLFVHPLTDATSATVVWVLLVATLLILLGLPFLPQPAPAPVARVDPANCNGCRRCFADCPYAAITMVPHPHWQTPGRPIRELAQVDADLCASCGICVGACPSSTPFRSGTVLLTGIDMPQQPIDALRRQLEAGLSAMHGEPGLVVVRCDHGPGDAPPTANDVVTLSLVCTGMLPPSFIEYALRGGAAGVVVTGCHDGDCAFRFGQRWTEERLRGEREPHLRAGVPRPRLRVVWPTPSEPRAVARALDELRHAARRPTAPACEPHAHHD
ncbi:MAG: hydrogenase iron-sulfur subunit [Burkholderiales bacterium]|nr:hydrogenase iron-sulfur subunit [Burkholderiales bacterium]